MFNTGLFIALAINQNKSIKPVKSNINIIFIGQI